jgi:hypothetical protein
VLADRFLGALLLAGALAACSGDDLPAMSQEKAKQQTQLYAGSTLTASGVAAFARSAANVTGCKRDSGALSDPDQTFYIQGVYQMIVPADHQQDVLGKVREEWRLNGYTIGSGAPGEIRAVTPDAYELSLAPEGAPALRLLISTPCYRNGS